MKEQKPPLVTEFDFTVQLNGESYPVEKFTDVHMLPLLDMFGGKMSDVQAQGKAGCSIKEIIVPSISDEIISVNRNGLYIINLGIQELNLLVLQVIKCYHLYELKDIQEGKKSKSLLAETQQKITQVQEAVNLVTTQVSLEKTISLSMLSPEEAEEAKNAKISELQEQLKKLQEK